MLPNVVPMIVVCFYQGLGAPNTGRNIQLFIQQFIKFVNFSLKNILNQPFKIAKKYFAQISGAGSTPKLVT